MVYFRVQKEAQIPETDITIGEAMEQIGLDDSYMAEKHGEGLFGTSDLHQAKIDFYPFNTVAILDGDTVSEQLDPDDVFTGIIDVSPGEFGIFWKLYNHEDKPVRDLVKPYDRKVDFHSPTPDLIDGDMAAFILNNFLRHEGLPHLGREFGYFPHDMDFEFLSGNYDAKHLEGLSFSRKQSPEEWQALLDTQVCIRFRVSETATATGSLTSAAPDGQTFWTAHHVIDDIPVTKKGKKEFLATEAFLYNHRHEQRVGTGELELLFSDPENDIALVRLARPIEGVKHFEPLENTENLTDVVTVGYPSGMAAATPGTTYTTEFKGKDRTLVNNAIAGGYSGGGTFAKDAEGNWHLVGVNQASRIISAHTIYFPVDDKSLKDFPDANKALKAASELSQSSKK